MTYIPPSCTEIFDYTHHCIGVQNVNVCKLLICISSFYLDVCFVFMWIHAYIHSDFSYVTILFYGLSTRFVLQCIHRIPPPNGMIWVHPGISSLTVSYKTTHDMFFSGHVYSSLVYASLLEKYIGYFAHIGPLFQSVVMIMTRSHYFMDIYAAFMTFYYFSDT